MRFMLSIGTKNQSWYGLVSLVADMIFIYGSSRKVQSCLENTFKKTILKMKEATKIST